MKNYQKMLVTIVVGMLIIPQAVLASWWNPFSWSWFDRLIKTETTTSTTTEKQLEIGTTTIKKTDDSFSNSSSSVENSVLLKTNQDLIIKKKESTIVSKPTPRFNPSVMPTQTVKVVAVSETKPQDLRNIAISQFLHNPTLDNFKLLCNQAKGLQGWTTKQGLDASREHMTTVNASLYEDANCKILDQTDITVYSIPDIDLNITFQPNDSDLVRVLKININNKIAELSKDSKFIIFIDPFTNPDYAIPTGVDPRSFASVAQYFIIDKHTVHALKFRTIISSLFSPVSILRGLQR